MLLQPRHEPETAASAAAAPTPSWLPCPQMPRPVWPDRPDGPNRPPGEGSTGRGHRHNAAQIRRDLFFQHCQQLVAQERLQLETERAQKEQLKAQLQEAQAALEKEKQVRANEVLQAQLARDKAQERVSELNLKLKVAIDECFEYKKAEARASSAAKQSLTEQKKMEEKANSLSRQLMQGMNDWKASSEQKQAKIDCKLRDLAVKEHEIKQLCKANDDLNDQVMKLDAKVDKQNQEWKQKYDTLALKYEAVVFGEAGACTGGQTKYLFDKNYHLCVINSLFFSS